ILFWCTVLIFLDFFPWVAVISPFYVLCILLHLFYNFYLFIEHSKKVILLSRIFHVSVKFQNEGPVEMLKTDLKPGNHILYTVRVYHPFIHKVGVRNAVLPRCSQEIVLLGSQTLDVLRDKVVCPCDLAVPGELSENPDKEFTARAKSNHVEPILRRFYAFVDTFYNDFRDPANIDYSRVIQDWASDHNIGPFNTALMERTRFEDLKMKLGYPYVYQHQGKCEHLLVFSNVRLLHSCDKLLSMLYPSLRSMSSSNSQYCIICGIYTARWVTFENDRVPHDPSYFCDSCFRSYNYIDGKKIGKFKAYPFFGIKFR
ncbi:hypothetical protein C0J52_14314, partial [Blattella germanica]